MKRSARPRPDTPKLLTTVNRMLKNFAARADLNRFAGRLENSGIAGTDIRFPFYRATALWLADALGVESIPKWPGDEQLMWHRLSPVIAAIADVRDWGRRQTAPDWLT